MRKNEEIIMGYIKIETVTSDKDRVAAEFKTISRNME